MDSPQALALGRPRAVHAADHGIARPARRREGSPGPPPRQRRRSAVRGRGLLAACTASLLNLVQDCFRERFNAATKAFWTHGDNDLRVSIASPEQTGPNYRIGF